MQTPPPARKSILYLLLACAATALALTPAAAAAAPDDDIILGMGPTGLLLLGAVVFAALALFGVKMGKKVNGFAVAAVLLVAAIGINIDWTGGTATPAPGSIGDAGTVAAFQSSGYEETSDVTLSAADAYSMASVNPVARIYLPGSYTEKTAFEGGATPKFTLPAMTDGSVTKTGVQVRDLGCKFDVTLDLASYYEDVYRDVDFCVKDNLMDNNDKSPATMYMEKIGTPSLSSTATSLTCAAGSQCTYRLDLLNSADSSYIRYPAVKWTNVANATLDGTLTGASCEIVEVASTQYIVYTGEHEKIGPLDIAPCHIKVSRASGSADGSFTLVADDLFRQFGASGWNTNSNIRSATATSTVTVSYA